MLFQNELKSIYETPLSTIIDYKLSIYWHFVCLLLTKIHKRGLTYLDDFKIKIIDDIAIVIVDILVATHRDAIPLWDEVESKSILNWDKIIIDLSACTYVDSTFVGLIVKIYKRISEKNGQLKLVFPETKAMIYFHTIGITRLAPCFNNLDQAVKSFDAKIPTRRIVYDEEIPNKW